MQFIYPKNGSHIGLTKNFEGQTNEVVLKLAHSLPDTEVYWYLDERFLRRTRNFHEIGVTPFQGKHSLTAVDALRNEVSIRITVE